ncbi:hypothetical protein [Dactylosporangium sp. NPDC000521]|uniref:hypothetical protein n=1 Tax=Dactylosporangium sp. NPDC000521 TaxID=3363975 RepID=UPI00367DBC5E
MDLTNDQRDGLNIALNEAAWLGIDVDAGAARATMLVEVLTLPPVGPAPDDTTRLLHLSGVSRVAASLRNGLWNDAEASVEKLSLIDLDEAVRRFGGCPIYGWEFIDSPSQRWAAWRHRLSLDGHLSTEPAPHVLELFQEGCSDSPRHLDLRVWFSTLLVTHRTGEEISLQEFIDGGTRWWDGLHAGDPRTGGKGIAPLFG